MTKLILASQSETRRKMLVSAGVGHVALRSPLDEETAKHGLISEGVSGRELALALAHAKAAALAETLDDDHPLVLGCDQVLICDDGTMLNKAENGAELAHQLRRLSGTTHSLHSAAIVVEQRARIWSSTETTRMTMRPLSDAFIADYVAQEGESLLSCVGGYKIEGLGAQLFSVIEGSHFAVLGLPLLPLLDFLRNKGLLPT